MGKKKITARLAAEEFKTDLPTLINLSQKKEGQYLAEDEITKIKLQLADGGEVHEINPTLAASLETIPATLYEITQEMFGKGKGDQLTADEYALLYQRTQVSDEEARQDPYEAYQKWEDDEVSFPFRFRRLRRYRKRVMQRGRFVPIILVRYRTPTGHERIIREEVVESRMKAGQLPYYLLGKDLEKAGIDLLSEFPGAPTTQTKCPYCNEELFKKASHVNAHLRDVLEAILTDKVKAKDVTFKRRHKECYQAGEIEQGIASAETEAVAEVRMHGGRDAKAEAKAVAEAQERWRERIDGFIGYCKRKKVSKSRINLYEQRFEAAFKGE